MERSEIVNVLTKEMQEKMLLSISSTEYDVPVIGVGMPTAPESIIWMFRPNVLQESKFIILDDECAIEYPGMFVKIKRPKMISVRYVQVNGESITMNFENTTARCILQEIDRMNGITIKNRANRYHWELAVKKWKKSNDI